MNSQNCFNEKEWEKLIQSPNWYLYFVPEYKKLVEAKQENREFYEKCKEQVYDFFEKHLEKGDIALGKTGPDWDEKRKPVDTIVIHHTDNEKPLSKTRLSAIPLLRLYANYYFKPYYKEEKSIQGQPIYSNHFRNGEQVFWTYHWIIRRDGSVERLLNDNEIGWHAGNWDVNTRSVAIVFDNNYENYTPSEAELKSVAHLISKYYPQVKKENIIGHLEVKRLAKGPNTTCPGNKFIDGWKNILLEKL